MHIDLIHFFVSVAKLQNSALEGESIIIGGKSGRRMLVWLLGVRVNLLVGGFQQISLFEATEESVRLYQAIDKIRKRFGKIADQGAITEKAFHVPQL